MDKRPNGITLPLPTNVLHEFDEINKSSMAAEVLSLKLRQAIQELTSVLGGLMNCSVDTKTNKQTTPPPPFDPKPLKPVLRPHGRNSGPHLYSRLLLPVRHFFFPGHSELMTNLLHTLCQQPTLRANPLRLKFLPGCDAD